MGGDGGMRCEENLFVFVVKPFFLAKWRSSCSEGKE
jgi:hypothetical protein